MKQTYLHKYFLSILLLLCGTDTLQAQPLGQPVIYNTPGIYTFTVPADRFSMVVTTIGGSGGNSTSGNTGGHGAVMQGTFAVTPGQTYKVLVGGAGEARSQDGGGGGGSFVWNTANNTLLVAAGGGGGAGRPIANFQPGGDASITTSGTHVFPATDGEGINGNGATPPSFPFYASGGAGWLTRGNDARTGDCTNGTSGATPLNGGAGGVAGPNNSENGNGGFGGGGGAQGNCVALGGGGGGGYSGGGGGVSSVTFGSGGGGGSYNIGQQQANSISSTFGNGQVTITYVQTLCTPTITASGPTTFCQGGSVTLTASVCSAYLWSNGATTQSITVNQSGSYSVRGINSVGTSPASNPVSVMVNESPAKPVITASGPTTFCAGGSVTLTAPAGFAAYAWSNGASTQAVVVSTTGNYSITVTNAAGCTSPASDPITVTVNALPAKPVITASGPTAFCPGGSVTLTAPLSTSYLWSNSAVTRSITVNSTGSYTVRVTNSNGCISIVSNPVLVTVNSLPAKPVITASGPATFCAGGSVILTAPLSTSYLWSNNATTQSITVEQSGSYSVTVRNNNGCSSPSSDVVNVTVNALPATPTVSVIQPTCSVVTGSITVSTPTGNDITYSINGTDYQPGSSFTIPSGTYNLTAKNGIGCVSSSVSVTISAAPALPATPTVSVIQPTCTVATGAITVNTPTGTGITYSIDGTTYQISNVFNNVGPGSYNVTVRNSTCTSVTTPVVINNQPVTPGKPTITASGPTSFCPGSSVTLTAPAGFAAYQWSNGATSQSIIINQSGLYSVVVKNNAGCSSPASDAITVNVADTEKPMLTCPAAQQFCYSSGDTYNIPALQASDNCSIQSISYVIDGATNRSGNGTGANGTFNPGISTITWTVRDASNNVSTCSTTVTVNSQVQVSIPDSKALNSNGVLANTVYVGYAPASSIMLTANASGGGGSYTYQWSTGATTRSITVSPTSTSTYTVTVTDNKDCKGTASKQVQVVDVSCGNKLDKVSVCHNGNTICISQADVTDHLNHPGDMLGECSNSIVSGRTAPSITVDESNIVASVYPNPNKGQFNLRFGTTKATKAEVQILNTQGIIISRKTVQTGGKSQAVSFNLSNPVAGAYLIKVVSEDGVQVLKMLIQP